MCGISGIIGGNIRPLKHALKHRGLDGDGELFRGMVALGHNRLSVIDLSEKGAQPIQTKRYSLTYNGEIYNYKDFYCGNGNDAHALLESIDSIGLEKTLPRLNGMFAFAVQDNIEHKIHLCVDRFAQKPLYYYHDGGDVFAFASSPNALLHLKDSWCINKEALQSYWMLGSVMGEQSIWEGIRKVDGSHAITFDINKKTINKTRYWLPEFQTNTNDIEELIIDAIDKVKIADVPVHIFLSGGIDSTLVASRFEGGNAVHLDSPEINYAKLVADKFNIDLKIADVKNFNVERDLINYSLRCGEPTMAGIIPYITAREAAKHCKVAISANGADELFFGYNRTQQSVTQAQWDNIFRKGFDYKYNLPIIDERLSTGRWLELQTYIQYDLNKTLDFASMAHTLEVRAPFLDHRLVEMALSIPKEKHGQKEILKNMLRKMGFDNSFLNRPKVGFSLHSQPQDMEKRKDEAFKWCVENNYLTVANLNGRDVGYLKYSALGFYYWYKTFKSIIE